MSGGKPTGKSKAGGKDMDGMTAKEISRLIDWLKSKEVSDADIIDCIQKLAK